MPRTCSIYGCRSNYHFRNYYNEKITTFSLPTDPSRRKLWLDRIPTDLSNIKKPGVCIKHFEESDIIRVNRLMDRGVMREFPRTLPKLTKNAVPTIFPPASQRSVRSRKKLRKCAANSGEGDKMESVVQQILMNPPEVIIKEEPVVKEEAECDVGAGAQQDFEFVSVKEEPVEDPDESTSPAPEESCEEEKGQDQQSPPIIKEEIDCDDYIDPLLTS